MARMTANGIELEYERLGDPAKPLVLPILGISDQLTDWPIELCDCFLEAGFSVVRFDLRDCGLSTNFDSAGDPDLGAVFTDGLEASGYRAPYDLHDLADDVLGLMDGLGTASAHLIGYSLGGILAQLCALKAPERVRSLTALQSTSRAPGMPPRGQAIIAAMVAASRRRSERDRAIADLAGVREQTNGSRHRLTRAEAQVMARQAIERAYCPGGIGRMYTASFATPSHCEKLGSIALPSYILHGGDDSIFPIQHGEDLARRIAHGKFEVIEGAGHNHPPSLVPLLAERLTDFVTTAERQIKT